MRTAFLPHGWLPCGVRAACALFLGLLGFAPAVLSGQGEPLVLGTPRKVGELAPLGVPTRNIGTAAAPRYLPAAFRVRLAIPGFVGPEVRVDVIAVSGGGGQIDGAGEIAGLPPTGFLGGDGLVLRRLADKPWEEGYSWYESETVVAIADLRAAKAYARTSAENAPAGPGRCVRCDWPEEQIPAAAREILSGDEIRVSLGAELRAALAGTYDVRFLDDLVATAKSVRWEPTPSRRQEPAQNPSFGSGDVVPGTLLHSGEFTQRATDLFVAARGLDFALTRTYRNQTVGAGPLGPGWELGFRMRLRALPDGNVELYDGRGRRELFVQQEDGTLASPAGRFVDLVRTGSEYLLVEADHTVHRFDRSGRRIATSDAVKDRATRGNEMRFAYDRHARLVGIVDTLGRSYELAYGEAGRLESVKDFSGREIVYEYDPHGRLAKVTSPRVTTGEATFPDGLSTQYEYDAPEGDLARQLSVGDNLAAVIDARDERVIVVDFEDSDGDGRVEETSSQLWGGHSLSVAYDFEARRTVVTDRRGNPWTYVHAEGGQVTRAQDPTGAAEQFEIDDEGLVTEVTRPLGGTRALTYDTEGPRRSRGNLLTNVETADSRGGNGSSPALTTTYEYESYSNQPIRVVDPRGAVTRITRNEVGLANAISEAVGHSEAATTTIQHNQFGQPTRIANGNGNVTTYSYSASGPSKGYLSSETVDPDGLALTTSFETDARGNVVSVTDPRGVRHEQTFNEVDWPVETITAASAATDGTDAPALRYVATFLYDENGNLVEERLPFGDQGESFTRIQREYGVLNELVEQRAEVTLGVGDFVTTRFEHDLNFNPVARTDPEGERTEFGYDSRNLLESLRLGAGTAEASEENFGRDAEGRRTSFVDGRGKVTRIDYDGFGRPMRSTDPLGHFGTTTYDNGSYPVDVERFDSSGTKLSSTGTRYDLLGRLVEVDERLWNAGDASSVRELRTSFVHDKLGNLLSVTDPLDRTSSREFDCAGRLRSATDALGNRSEWDLDGQGNPIARRLVEQVEGGAPITTSWTASFDALGRDTSSSDPLGNTTTRTFDARSRLRFHVDPEGFLTEATHDGLGRMKRLVRPEGVSVDYGYDRSSRLTSYKDALNHETTYSYDALHRLRSTTYPDETQQLVDYDAASNAIRRTDANGNIVTQAFDDANRLTGRTVALGAGVEGPTSESFAYDGLSRLITARSGLRTTTRSYDSLSRLASDSQDGQGVTYERDDAGNATRLNYPSGTSIAQQFDGLDRLRNVSSNGSSLVSYGFRGPDRTATKTLGNGVVGTMSYDGARRLVDSTYRQGTEKRVSEQIDWTARDLKRSSERSDLNGLLESYRYDGAKRLVGLDRDSFAALQGNFAGRNALNPLAGDLLERVDLVYDRADALVSRTEERYGVRTTILTPSDASGRNRPASIDGEPVEWDANGNLTRKGDRRFHWDFRNRLTRVSRDGEGEVARYEYDASNRLVRRVAGGDEEELTWSGWRLVERRKNGQLESRRFYGQGLDEVVREESELGSGGLAESVQIPIHDSMGNPVALLGSDGAPIERRTFSSYGDITIRVDPVEPRVDQLRERGDTLVLEISEEVLLERIEEAILEGELTLTDVASGEPIAVIATQPVREGKLRGRRLELGLDPGEIPEPNQVLRLRIESSALVDLFDNEMVAPYEKTFGWFGSDSVKDDTTAPRVELITTRDGSLTLQMSEAISPAVASAVILVDGAPIPWQLEPDGYTLIPINALSSTTHTLQIGSALVDLAGNPLAAPFTLPITTGAADKIAYEAPDERIVATPPTGNLAGFQGHLTDPATGLVYARNRFYDPEMGRFISADPMGYVDGPSTYTFGANDPLNNSDPLGLYTGENCKADENGDPGPGCKPEILATVGNPYRGALYSLPKVIPATAFLAPLVYDERGNVATPFNRPSQAQADLHAFERGPLGRIASIVTSAYGLLRDPSKLSRGLEGMSLVLETNELLSDTSTKRPSGVPPDDFVPNPDAGPYKRATETTPEQRASVQGQPCVDCGAVTPKQVADHIDPQVVQHFREGSVNVEAQRKVGAVQSHCPTCSAKQGGWLANFSRKMKSLLDSGNARAGKTK